MRPISWWRTTFGEEESRRVAESISHEHISQGVVTAEFERNLAEVLGVPYVVATTSGSTALLMALMAAGIGPGDEVIVPNRTWIATAHAPFLLGAKVVLADVEHDRPIIDVSEIEPKITPKTKAILPTHLNGRSADMETINQIARQYGIHVIEDAAQAFCSRNPQGLLGTQSEAGCFSLSVAKIIATGQGGFIATRSEQVSGKLRSIRTHGVVNVINAAWTQPGFNFRFTDVLASIGLVQLTQIGERIKRAKAIYERYQGAMPDLPFLRFLPVDVAGGEIPIYVEVLCSERDRLVQFLAAHHIETRPFYPDLDVADYLGCKGDFPNSRQFAREGLFLPCGPGQPLENVDVVIDTLRLFGKTA